MTQAAATVADYLEDRYPGIRLGRLNCRTIAGSDAWSQHAFYGAGPYGAGPAHISYHSNALDLYGPADQSSAMQVAFLDVVVAHLRQHEDTLAVHTLLWRVPDHYGHAHIDFWPYGRSRPPCGATYAGVVWDRSDGTTITTIDPLWEGALPMSVYDDFVAGWVASLDAQHVTELHAAGVLRGDLAYWLDLLADPGNPEWRTMYARTDAKTRANVGELAKG